MTPHPGNPDGHRDLQRGPVPGNTLHLDFRREDWPAGRGINTPRNTARRLWRGETDARNPDGADGCAPDVSLLGFNPCFRAKLDSPSWCRIGGCGFQHAGGIRAPRTSGLPRGHFCRHPAHGEATSSCCAWGGATHRRSGRCGFRDLDHCRKRSQAAYAMEATRKIIQSNGISA